MCKRVDVPRSVTPRVRGLIILTVLVVAAVGLTLALTGGGKRKLVPAGGNSHGTYDPLAYSRTNDAALERAAAAGEGHIVFAKSPGGVLATAKRTAHFRPLVEAAARQGHLDPDMLEAIVFLESAGRPEVIAGSDPQNASGLTQILAETGRDLLGMHIDLAASRRITKRIARARSQKALRHFEAQRFEVVHESGNLLYVCAGKGIVDDRQHSRSAQWHGVGWAALVEYFFHGGDFLAKLDFGHGGSWSADRPF